MRAGEGMPKADEQATASESSATRDAADSVPQPTSPLPWMVFGEWRASGKDTGWSIESEHEDFTEEVAWLAQTPSRPNAQPDAEFIARACNNHVALMDICKRVALHFADTDAPLGAAARAVLQKAERVK